MGQLSDLLRASLARLDTARYELRATDPDAAFTFMGEGARLLGEAIPQVEMLEGQPAPTPTPEPAPQFVAPVPPGAIYGASKWLLGSTGCDLFCRRGTPVVAPADCVVEEVLGGQGISGGAEIILSLPDKSWAWRYRHVQASVTVGQRVQQGQPVGQVYDTSLDQLCTAPVATYPDHFQHCDLSVAKGTDRFSPQGGGGGNTNAFLWLQSIGYQGTVVAKTPGPPSCGMGMADAVHLMTPTGRR